MHPYTTLKNSKVNPKVINADWSRIGNHAPWSLITSPMLAKVLGVHLQTISNWRIRGILPPAELRSKKLKGNIVRYRISTIRAWLEEKEEEELVWAWVKTHLAEYPVQTVGQAKFLVNAAWKTLGVDKPLLS